MDNGNGSKNQQENEENIHQSSKLELKTGNEFINKKNKAKNMCPPKPHPDHKYIQALASNDKKLIQEILLKFKRKVIQHIKRLGGNQADAEDAFQDALMDIFKQAIKPDFVLTCTFFYYIKIIAKRRWIERIGVDNREKEYINSQEKILIELELFPNDYMDHLEYARKELCPDCQKILHLYYHDDWCHEAIAEEMGYTIQFVKQKLLRCRKKLKKLLQSRL